MMSERLKVVTVPPDPYGQRPSYPPHPYGYPSVQRPPQPSAATAISAGVLAVLGGLLALVAFLFPFSDIRMVMAHPDTFADAGVWIYVQTAVRTIYGLLLLVGAVLLFRRQVVGKWLVVAGCVLATIPTLHLGTNDIVGGLMYLVPPIATLVLAVVPSTTRWIAARPPSRQGLQ